MLGPSFSPSIARIPGPTSSHSRCQRLRCRRAWWTRERSRERAVSSSVSRGWRSRGEEAATSGVPIYRSPIVVCPSVSRNRTVHFHTHRSRELAADRVLALAEPHEQRPAKRLALTHDEALSWGDAAIGQIAKHLGVRVRDAHKQTRIAGLQALHAIGDALFELEVGSGDRVAMGIDRGVSELGGDQLLEIIGKHVLQHLSLGMHAIPRHPQRLREIALEHAVMTDHLARYAPAIVGQAHAPIGHVRDQTELV